MVEVICKRCQYKWEYKGDRTHWASCPNCKTSVRIQMFVQQERNKIKLMEDKIVDWVNKYNELLDFVTQKNPLLVEEYSEMLIKKSTEQAEKEFEEVVEIGKQKN